MEYGRVGKAEPGSSSTRSITAEPTPKRSKLKRVILLILATTLIVASAVSAAIVVVIRKRANNSGDTGLQHRRPSEAISRACSNTRYPSLCVNTLVDFPGAITASEEEIVHISVNMTLHRFGSALNVASQITNLDMDPLVRSAYEDCLELLDHSVDLLSQSLTSVAPGGSLTTSSTHDVLTWLSAALTNQDTCIEGFDELNGVVRNQMSDRLKDLSEIASNSLAIYATTNKDVSGTPIQNRRRRLLSDEKHFPVWLSRRDRLLLDMPASVIRADVIVSKDGTGTCRTIAEAIKKAPQNSNRRFVIYVKAGRYEESDLKVGKKKTNLMFIGDGKGKTVISGGKSVQDKLTTFRTASFAATGAGFIARDMTFENWAGPSKHQAVALRVGADHSVIYHCAIIGYQDTLYAHSLRQFYRECDIYGTVDFIFGNAAVVFQNCTIHARKPMQLQKVTITAQGRKDPTQVTGISFHACRIVAEPDLEMAKEAYPTYLGRPWKMYSRTVYMLSYMGDHVHPKGWLEWDGTFALDTLYYGEYRNYGPGGSIGERVNWPGYRVITSTVEASKFTVAQFIYGSSWLPPTGVAFLAGLTN